MVSSARANTCSSGYSVTNYGVGGQTMFKPSHQVGRDSSYWSREQYQQALNSSANIVVLMLGTNDAKADRWQQWGSAFPLDYRDMVASFQAMKSKVHPETTAVKRSTTSIVRAAAVG